MPPTSNGNSRKVWIASMRRQIVMMPRLQSGGFTFLWRVLDAEPIAKTISALDISGLCAQFCHQENYYL
jgi:hypothetical protein